MAGRGDAAAQGDADMPHRVARYSWRTENTARTEAGTQFNQISNSAAMEYTFLRIAQPPVSGITLPINRDRDIPLQETITHIQMRNHNEPHEINKPPAGEI
jgi:hypothetical protein